MSEYGRPLSNQIRQCQIDFEGGPVGPYSLNVRLGSFAAQAAALEAENARLRKVYEVAVKVMETLKLLRRSNTELVSAEMELWNAIRETHDA